MRPSDATLYEQYQRAVAELGAVYDAIQRRIDHPAVGEFNDWSRAKRALYVTHSISVAAEEFGYDRQALVESLSPCMPILDRMILAALATGYLLCIDDVEQERIVL